MSKMTELISANKAYNLAYLENKSRLYQNIESAARCGDMYYDADCADCFAGRRASALGGFHRNGAHEGGLQLFPDAVCLRKTRQTP